MVRVSLCHCGAEICPVPEPSGMGSPPFPRDLGWESSGEVPGNMGENREGPQIRTLQIALYPNCTSRELTYPGN